MNTLIQLEFRSYNRHNGYINVIGLFTTLEFTFTRLRRTKLQLHIAADSRNGRRLLFKNLKKNFKNFFFFSLKHDFHVLRLFTR